MASSSLTIVTGGAGFIGSHLVNRLLARGESVRVLELPRASIDHLPLEHIDVVRCNIEDRSSLTKALRGCGTVYHIAGVPQLWTKPRGRFRRVNFQGAVNVIELALASGARRVLHTSSETIAPNRDDRSQRTTKPGTYFRAKYLAEKFALDLGRAGQPIVVVSPTVPVGPGDWLLSPPTQMVLDFCRGLRQEYVEGSINLIDVRDVAEGMIAAMELAQPGCVYYLGNEDVSLLDVFKKLSAATGIPEPKRRIPLGVALTAAYISEWISDVITRRTPIATVDGVKLALRPLNPHIKRHLQLLGLEPRKLNSSLSDTVSWLRHVGLLQQ